MKNNRNNLFYFLLFLVMLITFLLGLFLDWEKMPYSPVFIIGIGVILIRIISSQLTISTENQNLIFILFSLINFTAYATLSFVGFTGGSNGMMASLPVLIVIGILYVKFKERISNKTLGILSNLFIVACFMFATLLIIGVMGLVGMGV